MPCAERERSARDLCGKDVTFVRETLDPGFPDEAAARAHYERLLSAPFASLICMFERTRAPSRAEARRLNGQRWDMANAATPVQWKLSLGYWKIGAKRPAPPPATTGPSIPLQARAARKKALDVPLTAEEVQALAHAPLMAYRPQKALDVGLFEFIPPDNPGIIIADE